MDAAPPAGGVTRLLLEWGGGDERALDAMLPLVYDELRRLAGHFGGLTIKEITEVVGLSHATVERHWKFARAWLFSAMADPGPDAPP